MRTKTRHRKQLLLAAVSYTLAGMCWGQCPQDPPVTGDFSFGWDLATVGDWNIDGTFDFVAATLGYERPVVISGSDGTVLAELNPQDPQWDRLGSALATVEMSWPNRTAVIVGDRWGQDDPDSPTHLTGHVRVHDSPGGEVIWIARGWQQECWLGSAVAAGAVDLWGSVDGAAIIAGAPGYGLVSLNKPEYDNRGAAFVYSTDWLLPIHQLYGEGLSDAFGSAVAHLGAVMEMPWWPMGEHAFAVGAPGANRGTGRVYVYSLVDAAFRYALDGEAELDRFGSALAGGLDLNGDDILDFVVGAPHHGSVAPHAGRVYAVSGSDGALLWYADGQAENDLFGSSLAVLLDVSNDELADVLVGAPLHSSRKNLVGQAILLSGADGSTIVRYDGRLEEGFFGHAVAVSLDPNPRRGFVVSAWHHDDEGVVYRYSGDPLLQGDADHDGVVGQLDLAIILASYDLPPNDPNYNPAGDLDGDGDVDHLDLSIVLGQFGQRCGSP
ncbi:MAG: FG-GAP repeat protein [Phycisphaerales bacterium]|nr:FG-GAP repeat protein [Phycisphaerales bacterium]